MKTSLQGGVGTLWLQARITERWLQEMSPPAVPASQGPCKGVCSFYFRNEPHHLTPVSLGSQNLQVIFQATLAMSHFETDQAASCLAPDIFFLLNSTLDFCSFTSFQLQWLLFLPVNNSPSHTHTFAHFLQLLQVLLHPPQVSHHDLTR